MRTLPATLLTRFCFASAQGYRTDSLGGLWYFTEEGMRAVRPSYDATVDFINVPRLNEATNRYDIVFILTPEHEDYATSPTKTVSFATLEEARAAYDEIIKGQFDADPKPVPEVYIHAVNAAAEYYDPIKDQTYNTVFSLFLKQLSSEELLYLQLRFQKLSEGIAGEIYARGLRQ